ncbi:uncharacterized protein LOC144657543 [Oculina patagonica]
MGTSISLPANRRKNKIVTEIKKDNARLKARLQSLTEEASRLKAELREIADSSWEMDRVPVKKLRFGTDLPQCPLPNQIANTHPSSHGQKLRFEKVLGDKHDLDGKYAAIKHKGHVKTFHC